MEDSLIKKYMAIIDCRQLGYREMVMASLRVNSRRPLYGDEFIANPASLLFLFFIVFCTSVFIFESMKIWRRKPT